MNRHSNSPSARMGAVAVCSSSNEFGETPFTLLNALPIRAGWYRVRICNAGTDEVEIRLDFGLGFVGYHAIRAKDGHDHATLFVRLFKELRGVCVLGGLRSSEFAPTIEFERLCVLSVWTRRAAEQLHLWVRGAFRRSLLGANRHDRARRLWGWSGLQAFPASLRADGSSNYDQWRRVNRSGPSPSRTRDLGGWFLLIDARNSEGRLFVIPEVLEEASRTGVRVGILTNCEEERPSELSTSGTIWSAAEISRMVQETSLDWLLIVQPDVQFDAGAIAAFAEAAESGGALAVYSDNDLRSAGGGRYGPSLRTRFSPERLKSEEWLGGVVAFNIPAIAQCGLSPETREFPTSLELARNLSNLCKPDQFVHIPEVLYSRSARKSACLKLAAPLRAHAAAGSATIIIPTRNRADLLERCVESVLSKADRLNEIIIHDNASDDQQSLILLDRLASFEGVRVLRDEDPFNFSRINNEAAELARGDFLIFLNNDTEVLSADWIAELVSIAADPAVGCAGPLLLQPDGKIQHAGIVTGPGGIGTHIYSGCRLEDADPVAPLVRRDVSAVTGACMVIEKSKFLGAGGFDEAGLPVAFNDVDLCLRLEQQGLRSIFVPEVRLLHHGSATREADDFTRGSDRFRSEFKLMRARWGHRLDFDPYFPEGMRLTKDGPQMRLA